jgi:hypothetical protein
VIFSSSLIGLSLFLLEISLFPVFPWFFNDVPRGKPPPTVPDFEKLNSYRLTPVGS